MEKTDFATLETVAVTLEADLKHVKAVLSNPSDEQVAAIIEKHAVGKQQQVLSCGILFESSQYCIPSLCACSGSQRAESQNEKVVNQTQARQHLILIFVSNFCIFAEYFFLYI